MTQLALNALPTILPPHALDTILRATIAVTGWLCMAWRVRGWWWVLVDARATGGTTTTAGQGRLIRLKPFTRPLRAYLYRWSKP